MLLFPCSEPEMTTQSSLRVDKEDLQAGKARASWDLGGSGITLTHSTQMIWKQTGSQYRPKGETAGDRGMTVGTSHHHWLALYSVPVAERGQSSSQELPVG